MLISESVKVVLFNRYKKHQKFLQCKKKFKCCLLVQIYWIINLLKYSNKFLYKFIKLFTTLFYCDVFYRCHSEYTVEPRSESEVGKSRCDDLHQSSGSKDSMRTSQTLLRRGESGGRRVSRRVGKPVRSKGGLICMLAGDE